VADAVSVSVTALPVVDAGLNEAVTPDGNPVALTATLEANPFTRAIAIALVPDAPRAIDTDAGEADSEKVRDRPVPSPSARGTCRVRVPPVPLTVSRRTAERRRRGRGQRQRDGRAGRRTPG
jgi:hypothetical protein